MVCSYFVIIVMGEFLCSKHHCHIIIYMLLYVYYYIYYLLLSYYIAIAMVIILYKTSSNLCLLQCQFSAATLPSPVCLSPLMPAVYLP